MIGPVRRKLAVPALAAILACTMTPGAAAAAAVRGETPAGTSRAGLAAAPPAGVRVIVGGSGADAGAQTSAAVAAVKTAGGRVERLLPLIGGVAAAVPGSELPALMSAGSVRSVSPDARMTVQDSAATVDIADGEETESSEPRSVHRTEIGADRALAEGADGSGVTVALLDTGISPHPDLAGRVVPVHNATTGAYEQCVNLSGESDCSDGYGHGTFLAGLIAGSGADSGGRYAGVAPRAKLLSIKVGARDGSADVSNVLAGIQWAVSFRERYGIRVLNLSLGTDSRQPWQSDPLNYAVERAWQAGIVVVVSAGNLGSGASTITKPADDPWVITVGAADDRTTPAISDDRLPLFSSRGPTAAGLVKPDVVAPGAKLVSTRAYGEIDEQVPPAMPGSYRQGSGTSMATAVVSGGVAQMLSREPALSPNRVKFLVTSTARPVASASANDVGRGMVDVYAAMTSTEAGSANGGLQTSSGSGSLQDSRGTVRVASEPSGVVVDGVLTAQLLVWEPTQLLGEWGATAWYASSWAESPIYRSAWSDGSWSGHNWTGSEFYEELDTTTFYGHNWQGADWYGAWE